METRRVRSDPGGGVAYRDGTSGRTTRVQQSSAKVTGAPIRAAFYYGWFPETENWASHYTPQLGKYDSSNPSVVATQVAQAKAAGLDAFISSWWGRGTPTDQRLPLLLDTAKRLGFHDAPYYEPEGVGNPTVATVSADLTYLASIAAHYPDAWLRMDGKPVLFAGDLFDALPVDLRGTVDVVVCNAPYVPTQAMRQVFGPR